MDTVLLKEIKHVLLSFPEYWEQDSLLKSKVIDDLRDYRKDLIEKLLDNEKIRNAYTIKISNNYIFRIDDLIDMLRYKSYWDNSYTKYSNEIGLTSEGRYLKYNTDVVVDFPHKDCVLQGGMTNEEVGKKEVFYHKILAKEEIDILLEPKVFINVKKYDVNGEHEVKEFHDSDNLIIKGNNLIALYCLKERFAGKVKLIYIDPPYNTGTDSFKYNDRFTHSTWLTFMKNRLEVSKEFLKDDGVIFIQINDVEMAYLKVLCDEIFGRENYLNTISVRTKSNAGATGGGEDKRLKKNVEYLLCYCKDYNSFKEFNKVYKKVELMSYIKQMENEGKSWKYTSVFKDFGEKVYYKTIKDGSGQDINIYKRINFKTQSISSIAEEENISLEEAYRKYFDRIFTTENSLSSIRTRVREATDNEDNLYSIEYIPVSGKNKGKVTELFYKGKNKRLVNFLKETAEIDENGKMYKKDIYGTLWDGINWNNISREGNVVLPNGKKPEELLKIIIEMATNSGDIVMDYFLGSGTTAAVAHKLGRQYIGIEQLNYGDEDSVARLKNVINGDGSGISSIVNWTGGGSFVYAELYELNQKYVKQIQNLTSEEEIENVIEDIKEKAFLDFKVDIEKITNENSDFASLSLEEKKNILIQVLDANQMYLSYSEIDDFQYEIPESVKQFNHSFYNKS
ncbi:DNA methyltransferase [Geobacillus thermodenitrificans]|uniref:DNA methyltransferase n=1 Tax=Geobacillus thermodenitrificans TaxID=33940 RepID=A0ABY9Q7W3_GEOTD|nr:DNA methyltransferase [Geobacillus thermodenitrificans]WMV74959.1 DNA methyltransferase [Geobacillus thermodenitrificans]